MRCNAISLGIIILTFAIVIGGCRGGNVSNNIQITSITIPAWTEGQAGSFPIAATGGTPPYTCSVSKGALPSWAKLDGCTISGVAPLLAKGSTQDISPPFTIKVTDYKGKSSSKEFTITIKKVQITLTLDHVTCYVNKKCSENLIASISGGSSSYKYQSDSFAAGTPPLGTVVGIDGVLIGTPTKEGEYTFGVCAVDSSGSSQCGKATATIEKGGIDLNGIWSSNKNSGLTKITQTGNNIVMTIYQADPNWQWQGNVGDVSAQGTLNGTIITGQVKIYAEKGYCPGSYWWHDFSATLSEDGKTINEVYTANIYYRETCVEKSTVPGKTETLTKVE